MTVALVNSHDLGAENPAGSQNELALLQSEVRIEKPEGWRFSARPVTVRMDDEDSRIAALIYRDVREYAVGHTCSATWKEEHGEVRSIATTWLPAVDVKLVSADGSDYLAKRISEVAPDGMLASMLAGEATGLERVLNAIPDGYSDWIEFQAGRIDSLPEELRDQAWEHLQRCSHAEARMRVGIDLLTKHSDVRAAFRLMNAAMSLQRSWTDPAKPLKWRPFQMAFVLLNLSSLSDRGSDERRIMDLLWFPTGGGKTEAYLGLIAFLLFIRRLRAPNQAAGAGVACLMRYTLRLLTLQQFERASALILACEFIRQSTPDNGLPDLRAAAQMSIGLWVGSAATPNKMPEAIEALSNPRPRSSPKQLSQCPCCRGALTWSASTDQSRIIVRCGGTACALASRLAEFPILTVDEMIYANPPSLLIGTVDKFAQLARNGATRSLFRHKEAPPPDLVIQDELHLISGPLGSLVGMYEAAIDRLTQFENGRAKIIGSTATIRRAADQVLGLFGREVAQFPPPGLDADDSCFAIVRPGAPVRRYVGLTTAGRSAKFTLQAIYASLLQSVSRLPSTAQNGYYTLVGYFNALRELGGALPLVQDDVLASMKLTAERRLEEPRPLKEVVELTSRVSQMEIRDILTQLERAPSDGDAIDVLLATNMISVGVDVSRLAAMVVMGQPKTASEYIQATSRVGRDARMPGMVISVLNNNKSRDRSHFEAFTSWHEAIYRGVEATSVTPFASRARDKALHAAIVIMARHLVEELHDDPAMSLTAEDKLRTLSAELLARVVRVDETEAEASRAEVEQIIDQWRDRTPSLTEYWNDKKYRASLLIAAEHAAARQLGPRSVSAAWPTLNAMRNVESTTQVKLVEGLGNA